ncbi:phospho-2-dehydro-3-deoxyheptonate aldolase domain protein [Mycobacterium xenopi 3993]|nr:phospho-2-dehydro-3-deoxyheptonate aldolase domain protein [Mycobacterium xenopi 3993]
MTGAYRVRRSDRQPDRRQDRPTMTPELAVEYVERLDPHNKPAG